MPADLHCLTGLLKRIRTLLLQLHELRGYDEWTPGNIDVIAIANLRETLRPIVDEVKRRYAWFLVQQFGLDDVCGWFACVRHSLKDNSSINLDTVTPDHPLIKSISRLERWSTGLKEHVFWLYKPDEINGIPDRIATFVNRNDAVIDETMEKATHYLGPTYTSFASACAGGDWREMARAIYDCLKQDYALTYEFERWFSAGEQAIRTPEEIYKTRRGTCLDLVILYLNCVANAKLAPILVIIACDGNQHAFASVGPPNGTTRSCAIDWSEFNRRWSQDQLLAFECTGFTEGFPGRRGKLTFRQACEVAEELIKPDSFQFAVEISDGF